MGDDEISTLLERLWGRELASLQDVDAFIRLVRDLPLSRQERKYALMLFCDRAGVVPTRELYEAAGASEA